MFYRSLLVSFALLCLLGAGLIYKESIITEEDQIRYTKLVDESVTLRSKKIFEKRPGIQLREKVQKSIWTLENEKRVQTQIFAKQSELSLFEKNKTFEIKERLFDIEAWMEGGRSFTAEEGIFSYPEQSFTAFEANFKIDPDGSIFSPRIEVLSSKNLVCAFPKGSFRGIDFEAEKLILHPGNDQIELFGRVQLQRPDGKACGNQAILTPSSATLSGDVCLKVLDGIGFADELTVNPQTKEFTLSAKPEKRVLFYKQQMHLSAPEITIDPVLETIKGTKDVRFSFTLEEENEIDQLMQRFSPS